jgi:2-succinyl-6-hydroxy-2,4-cyclohexadiene-1-carboxylate synthase
MLNVRQIGQGSGTPVVCLHGFMGSAEEWDFFAESLHDRMVLAIDLPGHGSSLKLPESAYSIEGAGRSVVETLGRKGIKRCHLVGYSMGGRVALWMALSRPEILESLVLISASPGIERSAERIRRVEVDDERAEALRNEPLESFLDAWYRQAVFSALDVDARASRVRRALENDPTELARAVSGMSPGRMPYLGGNLTAISIPLLYISGAADEPYVRIGARIEAEVTTARHVSVPDVGHDVHRERPQQVAELLRTHIDTIERWPQ